MSISTSACIMRAMRLFSSHWLTLVDLCWCWSCKYSCLRKWMHQAEKMRMQHVNTVVSCNTNSVTAHLWAHAQVCACSTHDSPGPTLHQNVLFESMQTWQDSGCHLALQTYLVCLETAGGSTDRTLHGPRKLSRQCSASLLVMYFAIASSSTACKSALCTAAALTASWSHTTSLASEQHAIVRSGAFANWYWKTLSNVHRTGQLQNPPSGLDERPSASTMSSKGLKMRANQKDLYVRRSQCITSARQHTSAVRIQRVTAEWQSSATHVLRANSALSWLKIECTSNLKQAGLLHVLSNLTWNDYIVLCVHLQDHNVQLCSGYVVHSPDVLLPTPRSCTKDISVYPRFHIGRASCIQTAVWQAMGDCCPQASFAYVPYGSHEHDLYAWSAVHIFTKFKGCHAMY